MLQTELVKYSERAFHVMLNPEDQYWPQDVYCGNTKFPGSSVTEQNFIFSANYIAYSLISVICSSPENHYIQSDTNWYSMTTQLIAPQVDRYPSLQPVCCVVSRYISRVMTVGTETAAYRRAAYCLCHHFLLHGLSDGQGPAQWTSWSIHQCILLPYTSYSIQMS